MKKLSSLLLCLFCFSAFSQTDSLKYVDVLAFQKKLNEEYKNPDESPLDPAKRTEFTGHDFFPVDLSYRVTARLTVTEGTPFFAMKTTTSRFSTERIYGRVAFTLKGKDFDLPVYQSKDLMQTEEYADYLFFPFTDLTNGQQTYSGGRYIDLRIPKSGDSLVIDFNKAYNPYCAYSSRYSCPIVPADNNMDIEVLAGVRYIKKDKSSDEKFGPGMSGLPAPEKQPEFPGGYNGLVKFLRDNMTYPKSARKNKIEGVVYVQFTVGADGSLSDIQTLKGISPDCDEEAKRVVALMPKWIPGENKGEKVAVNFILPISFKGSWNKK